MNRRLVVLASVALGGALLPAKAAQGDPGFNSPSIAATQPAVGVEASGLALVAYQNPNDNSLVVYWANAGSVWSSAVIAGPGTTYSNPAIFIRSSTEADIVARGANNSLEYYSATPGSSWSHTTIAGPGSVYAAPSIFVASNGEAEIAVQGPNNSLVFYWTTGTTWSPPATIGTAYSAPSIFVRSSGEADIAVQGANNSLGYYWAQNGGGWAGASIAGNGTTYSAPSIVVRSSGEADVVAQGANNTTIYCVAMPGGSWGINTIAGAGTTFSAPAIFVRSSGEADVVFEGPSDSLDEYSATPGSNWTETTLASMGTTYSAPSIFVRSSGEADVVAAGFNQTPTYYFQPAPGNTWRGSTVVPSSSNPSDTSLAIPPVAQLESNWCWDAVDQMIMAYYGVQLNQCTGATDMVTRQGANGPENCCNGTNAQDTNCNHTSGLHIDWYGFPAVTDTASAVAWSTLQSEIAASRPVVANWNWNSGGSHFLLAIGAHVVNGQDYVTVNNPAGGEQSDDTYAYYVGGNSYDHTTAHNYTNVVGPSH
jgi:hypothetical protein